MHYAGRPPKSWTYVLDFFIFNLRRFLSNSLSRRTQFIKFTVCRSAFRTVRHLILYLICMACKDRKNRTNFIWWPEVVKGIPNQASLVLSARAAVSVCLLRFRCIWRYVSLFLVVSNSAINSLEWRLWNDLLLNPTHSLTHLIHTYMYCVYVLACIYILWWKHHAGNG